MVRCKASKGKSKIRDSERGGRRSTIVDGSPVKLKPLTVSKRKALYSKQNGPPSKPVPTISTHKPSVPPGKPGWNLSTSKPASYSSPKLSPRTSRSNRNSPRNSPRYHIEPDVTPGVTPVPSSPLPQFLYSRDAH